MDFVFVLVGSGIYLLLITKRSPGAALDRYWNCASTVTRDIDYSFSVSNTSWAAAFLYHLFVQM